MMKIQFILFFLFTSALFAQSKIDSLFPTKNHFENLHELDKLQFENKQPEEKLPLQYFLLQSKMYKLDEKFFLNDKLFQTELIEGYTFGKDELDSGLSEDGLLAYLKNKKSTMKILADTYYQHADVNWEKIQRILGLSKTAAAIILGMISMMKYH